MGSLKYITFEDAIQIGSETNRLEVRIDMPTATRARIVEKLSAADFNKFLDNATRQIPEVDCIILAGGTTVSIQLFGRKTRVANWAGVGKRRQLGMSVAAQFDQLVARAVD